MDVSAFLHTRVHIVHLITRADVHAYIHTYKYTCIHTYACTHTYTSASSYKVQEGYGTAKPILVTTAAGVSELLTVDFDPPVLTTMTPVNGSTSGGFTVFIDGSSFSRAGSGASAFVFVGRFDVEWNGKEGYGACVCARSGYGCLGGP